MNYSSRKKKAIAERRNKLILTDPLSKLLGSSIVIAIDLEATGPLNLDNYQSINTSA